MRFMEIFMSEDNNSNFGVRGFSGKGAYNFKVRKFINFSGKGTYE